jgi:hypothetical protein
MLPANLFKDIFNEVILLASNVNIEIKILCTRGKQINRVNLQKSSFFF